MKLSLSSRLLAVALLGIFACAVALYGVGRILQITVATRIERAREAVVADLAVMRRDAPKPLQVSTLGMRGGFVASVDDASGLDPAPDAEEPVRRALATALRSAAATRDVALQDAAGTDALVVAAAAPTAAGSYAWILYGVKPPQFLGLWRLVTVALTIATVLLVATTVSTVVAVRRGASALNGALEALAEDLASPVPRPPVPELADLADHIQRLAGALARAQADKERLGAELAQRDRLAALGRVVAGVAHEVRNPLAAIKLKVDLGRIRADTPAQLATELGAVSDEVTRLDRLVADLLVVAGRRTGSRVPAALGALVEQRAALLGPWAIDHGVSIEVTGDATCALDTDAVARAVDNLLRNAVEASPTGSSVDVEIVDADGGASLCVRDHGRGVDEGRAAELFEPFFTTKPDGTGLGLALSRAIAAAHGGTLTYAREDSVTCFELTFPRGVRGAAQAAYGGARVSSRRARAAG